MLQDARELRQRCAETLLFAVVDTRRPDLTTEAVLAGVADVFARPLSGRRVANAIDRELGHDAPQAPSGTRAGDDLFHHSAAMRDVMTAIGRAAGVRSGVTIRGEEGTGRQLVARAIHVAQGGRSEDFITVDCAAYDGDRLDVELFGVGAARQNGEGRGLEHVTRRSRLHAALGGTLYLQNVAEAPTSVQARLARVLRDREAVLVDSGAPIGVDVRPMAGVGPGFDKAVREGRVRDDLVRRLSTTRVDIPPLRDRREDIPALANFFLREICASLRVPPKTLSRPAFSLISALPWRGNAAELRALLHSVVSGHAGGRGISLDDLLGNVRLDGGSVVVSSGGTLKQARAVRARVHRRDPGAASRANDRRGEGARNPADESVSKNAGPASQLGTAGIVTRTTASAGGVLVGGFVPPPARPRALAQADPNAPPASQVKVRLGPVLMNPAVTFGNVGVDENVFNEPTDPKRDFTMTISPRTTVWLRFLGTWFTGAINEDIVWYQNLRRNASGNTQLGSEAPRSQVG